MERQEKSRPAVLWTSAWGTWGFTFFELVVVLLLLSIFAMLGWPALNGAMGDARLSGAAQEVVNALEYARLSAMTSGQKTRVVIRAPQDRIAVTQFHSTADLFTGGNTLPAADVENGTFELMGYPLNRGTDYQIDFPDDRRFQGVDITASDFGVGDPVIFDTLGGPSKGGTVTVALGSRQMVVTLDAVTGRVTVSQ